jgi:hypothetical protein
MNAARSRSRALLVAFLGLLLPGAAAPCGAFYGDQVEVDPDQSIVLVHRAGIETYVFRPRFCGAATDFGVILPVPSTLTANPALASAALFDQLAQYTVPATEEACAPAAGIGCGSGSANDGTPPGFGVGVDVIDGGRVGIFEWSLVQATSVAAFTDWLSANGFPYDAASTDAYQHYVTAGWYFVAFKVSAGADAPPEGMRLCGDLGPIQLAFASAAPVVPARIAGVNADPSSWPTWRIFVVAPEQQRVAAGAFYDTLYFSGTLLDAGLAGFGELAAISENGERLTAIDVRFQDSRPSTDVLFEVDPSPADFRSTITTYKDCGGCQAGGAPAGFAGAAAVLALLRALRRWRVGWAPPPPAKAPKKRRRPPAA